MSPYWLFLLGSNNVLELPEYVVPVFEDEGTVKKVDINDYGGDILRSNFEYCASSYAMLELEEIDYLLGRVPRTTEARYYCDYDNKYIQLQMRVKLDRWAVGSTQTMRTEKRRVVMLEGGQQYTISSVPQAERKEICIELDVADIADANIDLEVFSRFGGSLEIEYYDNEEG